MKKTPLLLICFLICTFSQAQTFKVLIFHKTNGFRHSSAITAGINLITQLGQSNGWTADASQDSNVFTDTNLARYKVVIWANTSGNDLLTGAQQQAFERYIRNGGSFVGIHAATDTYRNKSWPWYNDLVGAIVQTNPNHTPNGTPGTMNVLRAHPITAGLGTTWTKNEEWYYWDLNGGYLYSQNINLLEVQPTGSKSYDRQRPITWYKNYDGGRSFYTALGHNGSDYVANTEFGNLLKNGILWAANGDIVPIPISDLKAVAAGCQSVKLTWSDVKGETGYRIRRRLSSESIFVNVKDIGANATSFSDATPAGTAYVYQVRPLVNNVAISTSNLASITVASCSTAARLAANVEQEQAISAFPNPASERIQLSGVARWRLLSLQGQLLGEGKGTEVPMTHIQSGLYLLEIGNRRLKVVKN